jgi:hypothetical protein
MLKYTHRIKTPLPSCQISYIAHQTHDSEANRNQRTQLKRGLKIDCIVEDKEYDESELPPYFERDNSFSSMGTMSIQMMQKNVSLNNYSATNPETHKFVTWVQELERIALVNSAYLSQSRRNMDLSISSIISDDNSTIENIDILYKKIVTRLMQCCNYIASEGRIGPGNVVFVGTKVATHLLNSNTFLNSMSMNTLGKSRRELGNCMGLDFVVTPEIDSDTFLVFRKVSSNIEPTLCLVEHETNDNRWAIVDCGQHYCVSFKVT